MKKINKNIICLFVIVFLIIFISSVVWILISSIIPPDKEKMEKCFQTDKDDLIIVADYLRDLNYSYVSIDESDINNGVMFTGAYTRHQKIEDATVLECLNNLLNSGNYSVVGKSEGTVFFQKWRFREKDRGIAVPINKGELPIIEFLIRSEMLSENGWYYYEADYEEYRNNR